MSAKATLSRSKNMARYAELDEEIKRMCNTAKKEWLDKEGDELERLYPIDAKRMHEKVKDLSGKKRSQQAFSQRKETSL
jgi:hypothetical protein